MRITVTGATGFLGFNLVRRLVAAGHRVRALVRSPSSAQLLDRLGVEMVAGDLQNPDSILRAVAGADAVFHMAGWVSLSPFSADLARVVNVIGTRNVLFACEAAKVQRLVHTSSIVTIGHSVDMEPVDETIPWNFQHLDSPYFNSKREAEQLVLAEADAGSIDAVVVNPAFVLGPWDSRRSSGRFVEVVATRWMPFYPIGGISVVHVSDVVDGHLLALERGVSGRRYILGGDNISFRALVATISDVAGQPPPIIPLHPAWVYPFALLGNLCGRWWPALAEDVNTTVLRTGCLYHYVSSQRAQTELGYTARPARAAVQDEFDTRPPRSTRSQESKSSARTARTVR